LTDAYSQNDILLTTVPYMKANHLSVFSGTASSEFGKPLASVFPLAGTSECVGFLKGGLPIGDPGGPGLRLTGWAWDAKHRQTPSTIIVTTNGTITGLGAAGAWLPEGRNLYPRISSRCVGFYAFVPPPPAGAVVNLYAVLRGNPPPLAISTVGDKRLQTDSEYTDSSRRRLEPMDDRLRRCGPQAHRPRPAPKTHLLLFSYYWRPVSDRSTSYPVSCLTLFLTRL
jgi:hypothetical protein